jgi:hypothetical protein
VGLEHLAPGLALIGDVSSLEFGEDRPLSVDQMIDKLSPA